MLPTLSITANISVQTAETKPELSNRCVSRELCTDTLPHAPFTYRFNEVAAHCHVAFPNHFT